MIHAFVQARMGSKRLPGKALLALSGEPMLARVIERVHACALIDEVIVVTGQAIENDPIRDWCASVQCRCYSGEDRDVIGRFLGAAQVYEASRIVRITADCPFVEPDVLTRLVRECMATDSAYGAVVTGASRPDVPRYPDGLDAEFMTMRALLYAANHTGDDEREHVTRVLWRSPRPMQTTMITPIVDFGSIRLTVDTADDYALAKDVYAALYVPGDERFHLSDVLRFLLTR